ncbi:MAG: hypothetical protein ACXVPK_12150, partial [Tumebacillaceae bacterium]
AKPFSIHPSCWMLGLHLAFGSAARAHAPPTVRLPTVPPALRSALVNTAADRAAAHHMLNIKAPSLPTLPIQPSD